MAQDIDTWISIAEDNLHLITMNPASEENSCLGLLAMGHCISLINDYINIKQQKYQP